MTGRSIIASKKAVENGGNITRAMLDAGYSPATANNPSNLTKTKAYQQIVIPKLKKALVDLDTYINNIGIAMHANVKHRSYVSETIKEGNKTIKRDKEVIFSEEPDIHTRLAGNKQAEKLLKIDQLVGISDSAEQLEPEDLEALASASDEIELTKILFRKNKS